MALIVCKFGGTSVASPERIQMVAKRLIARKQAGHDVVAVVSAMGKTTDELVGLAAALNDNPPAREMDRLLSTGEQVSMTLLAMAIEARGYKAMSFTGRQAGIETDGTHAKAKIVKVHNERIMEAVNKGMIAVVAGFQGIDANGDITTLGRGGSDTTAVAVAWGLNADVCEIYSDVDGVYSADPRVAPRARKLDQVSYEDMLELSGSGAGVLQMRAVEFARKWNVVIHSRSAFSDAEGTYIKEEPDMEEAVITGIAHDTSEIKFTIRGVPDMTGVAAKVFSALAGNMVSVDMIIQNTSESGTTDISFTCPGADEKRARETLERIMGDIQAREYVVDEDIAKVSMVGTGMKSSPGVAAKAFQTLGENKINILAISTSPIRLSVVVDSAQTNAAVRCLHTAFGLDSDSVFEEKQLSAEEVAAKMNKGR
ncbi:aspartate kinase [Xiamenia xianingshaonis]|uniref:Aspartokinase n=1 Tax=Xiamenia xianingshaonis TaxID=2682776 RepID=A0A9E6SU04_9ACTN|nr:aspartate kinase [Xiamenia xianingshaonis]NGM17860.1 aspartate kinase [Eggerthellaceae bacterium zg-893]NHM14116.1 aspartate kinase [Xiamenia xianingshaonis]NHM16285.1 aspartate kinase [Xiamenia xianingshaonis]QTU83978.1 aspartate kinase [Xiamenia xianingshaonis]